MTQSVNVPGVGTLQFPDGMSQQDMAAAIQKNYPQIHADKPAATDAEPKADIPLSPGYGGRLATRAEGVAAGALGELQQTNDSIQHLADRLGLPPAKIINRLKNIPTVKQHLNELNDWIKTKSAAAPEEAKLGKQTAQIGEMVAGGEGAGAIAKPLLEAGTGALSELPVIGKAAEVAKPYIQASTEGAAGFAAPTPDKGQTRMGNAVTGAVTGGATEGAMKVLGGVVKRGLNKVAASNLARSESVLPRAIAIAKKYGYKITPKEAQEVGEKHTALNTMESIGGSPHLSSEMSKANQQVTDRVARQGAEIPRGMPLNDETINKLNAEGPGKVYREVEDTAGIFKTDDKFKQDVLNIFPVPKNMPPDKQKAITALKMAYYDLKSMDAREAMQRVQSLREDAERNYTRGTADEVKLAKAQKNLANAIESQVERRLQKIPGKENLINEYRDARKLFAKRFALKEAISSGHVDIQKLARSSDRDKFTGEFADLATIADEFKTVTKTPEKTSESAELASRQDTRYLTAKIIGLIGLGSAGAGFGAHEVGLGAGAMASIATAGAALAASRPAFRKFLMSDWGQKWIQDVGTREARVGRMTAVAKFVTAHPKATAATIKAFVLSQTNQPNTLQSIQPAPPATAPGNTLSSIPSAPP
jgi:hypothetical protein